MACYLQRWIESTGRNYLRILAEKNMWEEILKAIPVLLSSMLKFVLGPIGGRAAGLHMVTTMIATAGGAMTSVVAFTFFGKFLKERVINRIFKRKEKPYDSNTRMSKILKKYGIAGIAFLTPILLTPIGGTILAVSVEKDQRKILLYMLISSCVWAVIFTVAVYLGYDAVVLLIKKMQPV